MNHTNNHFDCILVGGPNHAQRITLSCSADDVLHPTLMSHDGQACTPVAFRRSADGSQLWLLLHPEASGAQLREMLVATEETNDAYKGPERRRAGLHFLPSKALAEA